LLFDLVTGNKRDMHEKETGKKKFFYFPRVGGGHVAWFF